MIACVILVMPVLMTALALALTVGERLAAFPNKDDLWQLPCRSSVI